MKNFLIISLLAIIASCNSSVKDKRDVFAYLYNERNHLCQKKNVSGIDIQLLYVPTKILHERLMSKNESQKGLDVGKSKIFFILSLSAANHELLNAIRPDKYSDLINTLSFNFKNYVSLRSDQNDDQAAEECFFQPTYGMASSNEILIAFDRNAVKEGDTFDVIIREFGLGVGNLKFTIDRRNMDKIEEVAFTI